MFSDKVENANQRYIDYTRVLIEFRKLDSVDKWSIHTQVVLVEASVG